MTDHDKLRAAIETMRNACAGFLFAERTTYLANAANLVIEAAESTLPRKRHVAYAAVGPHSAGSVYWSKEKAQAEAVCDWVVIELVGEGPA